MKRTPLLIANWKMYKTVDAARAFASELVQSLRSLAFNPPRELVIAPSAVAIWPLVQILSASGVALAAQTLDLGEEGAMTGAISAYLLKAAGAQYVIVGHSERRRHFGEDDTLVAKKAEAAWARNLWPVICVGESAAERENQATEATLKRQLDPVLDRLPPEAWERAVVAYEPVWAIGSGQIPTLESIDAVCRFLRTRIARRAGAQAERTRLLYGGSVQAENIGGIWNLAEVDGALVGGASLQRESFLAMARTPLNPE